MAQSCETNGKQRLRDCRFALVVSASLLSNLNEFAFHGMNLSSFYVNVQSQMVSLVNPIMLVANGGERQTLMKFN